MIASASFLQDACRENLRLEVFHDESISDSEFASVGVAENDATGRAASSGRVRVISWSAAGAAMHEEGTTAAHLTGLLGLEVESAGPVDSLMHHIHAVAEFVGGCWERASVDYTLLSGVVVAFSLSGVAVSVDGVLT